MNDLTLICHNNKTLVYSEKDNWYIIKNDNGNVEERFLNKKENPGYAMACITKWGMKQDCDESFLNELTKELYKNYKI
ncbi:hypothetical protein [Methanobrevibacter sp.]|uniref:hypothetical protein n=1 Tax=Methanobrevibacter sp. TaxID=66852 RepID=UPI00386E5060